MKVKAKDLKEGDRLAKSESHNRYIDIDAGERGDGSFHPTALSIVYVSKRGVFVIGIDLVGADIYFYCADYDLEDELEIDRAEEAS